MHERIERGTFHCPLIPFFWCSQGIPSRYWPLEQPQLWSQLRGLLSSKGSLAWSNIYTQLPLPHPAALWRELLPRVLLGRKGSSRDHLNCFMVLSITLELQKCFMFCKTEVLLWCLYSVYISSFIAIRDYQWQTGSPDTKDLVWLVQINEKDKGLGHKYEIQGTIELVYFYISD